MAERADVIADHLVRNGGRGLRHVSRARKSRDLDHATERHCERQHRSPCQKARIESRACADAQNLRAELIRRGIVRQASYEAAERFTAREKPTAREA